MDRALADPKIRRSIKLVQDCTYELMKEGQERPIDGIAIAQDFYSDLIGDHPEVSKLFKGVSMARQNFLLWSMLITAIVKLTDEGFAHTELKKLGARHVRYGVVPDHFKALKVSLLRVLEKHLVPKRSEIELIARVGWDGPNGLKNAWSDVIDVIALGMLTGM